MGAQQQFSLVLIKPSHYDDDGYVIQWFRSAVPSNSLAVVHGLVLDCKERRVLGDDVEIVVTTVEEDNTRIRTDRIVRQLAGGPKPNRPDIGESKLTTNAPKIIQRWRRICGIAAIFRTRRLLISDGVATWNIEL